MLILRADPESLPGRPYPRLSVLMVPFEGQIKVRRTSFVWPVDLSSLSRSKALLEHMMVIVAELLGRLISRRAKT